MDEKHNWLGKFWENFENFRKFAKISRRKMQNCCIFAYFAKKLQNHALNFRAFGRKTQFVGEILRKFWKFSKICKKFPKKMAKMLYFSLFCKEISKPCGQFLRVWTKNTSVWEILRNFWWKFNGKIEFFSIFWEHLLLKIETSEITSLFYNNFFRFGG